MYLMIIADVICYLVPNLLYEFPEDGIDVPKHVGIAKGHTFKCLQHVHCFGFINEN
jgi:hypothetical protein